MAPTTARSFAPATPGVGRDHALDALRGVAALTVFGFHAWLYTLPVVRAAMPGSLAGMAAHELRLGLVLFFVLSGHLLFTPWVRAVRDGRPPPSPARYALRRAARIAPAYYLALGGSIALLWNLGATPGVRLPDPDALWRFLVFAQNTSDETVMKLDPPMWTLAIEVSFYVLLPVVGWLTLRGRGGIARLIVLPAALIGAGVAWNAMTATLGLGMTWTKALPAMVPYFALGMLVSVWAHGPRRGTRGAVWPAIGGVALVVADAAAQAWHGAGGPALIPFAVRDLPAGIGFAALIAAAATARGARSPAWRPLAAVGTVSYGLYLWHVPVLLWLRGHRLLPLNAAGATAVALPLSLALAAASWRWVEQPAIAWARRLRRTENVFRSSPRTRLRPRTLRGYGPVGN